MSVEVLMTISPTTNEPIITRNGLSASEAEELPNIATKAFESWRQTSLTDRQIIVKRALQILESKKDELGQELTLQMGRPIRYTAGEVATAVKRGEYLLKVSAETLKDTPGEGEKGFRRFIRKVPVGPVLIVFAWNVSTDRPSYHPSYVLIPMLSVPVSDPRQLLDPCASVRKHRHPEAITPDTHCCRAGRQGLC
jgi:acyl-CoA reductase-like NAD-dependent aldehyde dehydrogenase